MQTSGLPDSNASGGPDRRGRCCLMARPTAYRVRPPKVITWSCRSVRSLRITAGLSPHRHCQESLDSGGAGPVAAADYLSAQLGREPNGHPRAQRRFVLVDAAAAVSGLPKGWPTAPLSLGGTGFQFSSIAVPVMSVSGHKPACRAGRPLKIRRLRHSGTAPASVGQGSGCGAVRRVAGPVPGGAAAPGGGAARAEEPTGPHGAGGQRRAAGTTGGCGHVRGGRIRSGPGRPIRPRAGRQEQVRAERSWRPGWDGARGSRPGRPRTR